MFLDVLHSFFVLYSFSMFRIVSFWNSWNLRVLLAISFWKRWKLYVFLRLCCPAGIKEMNTFFLPKRLNHDCTEVSHKFPYTWGKTLPLKDYNTLTKKTLWDIMIFHLWDRWSFLITRISLKSRTQFVSDLLPPEQTLQQLGRVKMDARPLCESINQIIT